MRGGWGDEQATSFLCAVCRAAGDEDPFKRATTVAQARAKHLAGTPYTGWTTLTEHVNPRIVSSARDLLGMSDSVDGSVLDGAFAPMSTIDTDPDDPLNVVTPGKKSPCTFKEVVYLLSQSPAWVGVFRFNVLSRKHVAVRPPFRMRMEQGNLTTGDIGKIRNWFDSAGYKVSSEAVVAAIATVCESAGRSWNPFVEYLDSLPAAPAGGLALSTTHLTIFKVADPLASVLLTKTLVAAVRRCRAMPGVGEDPAPVDHQGVLLLAGDQDAGKGHLIHILAGKFYKKLDVRRLKDKDTVIKAQGAVLVELEEVSCQGRDRDSLKALLSSCDDEERAAYERGAEVVQRSYAMIATTNDPRLEDPTGHRRWWPIILTPGVLIDVAAAAMLRDSLWSEANALALSDFDHHLTPAEKAQCAAAADMLEVEDSRAAGVVDACSGRTFITMREVYDHMTRGSKKDDIIPRGEEHAISDSLRRVGCVRSRPVVNGKQIRAWEVPASISDLCPSEDGMRYRASLEMEAGLRAATKN